MIDSHGDRFTLADYESILDAALHGGYEFARFTDPEPATDRRRVYLRHDVDNTLESAVRLAETEHRVGARATYLVMVRSENYNPFTGANVDRLRRIRELGHDIGLHFTAEEHDDDELRDLVSCIQDDAKLLEHAIGEPVGVFSFHNPSDKEHVQVEVPGLVNTYAARFHGDACYLSESNMRWRSGSPVDVLAKGEHEVVQILVHPLSYRADFRSDRDVLLWFLREKVLTLLELNVEQNRVLREQGITVADVAHFLAEEKTET
jgi:hypothetical protein